MTAESDGDLLAFHFEINFSASMALLPKVDLTPSGSLWSIALERRNVIEQIGHDYNKL